MKIKTDFVTNSSSTSYVVIVPNGFDVKNYLSIKEQAGFMESLVEDWEEGEPIPKAEDLQRVFEKVKRDGEFQFYCYECDEYTYEFSRMLSTAIVNLCLELELILLEFDTGSDDGRIFLMSEDKISKLTENFYAKIYNSKI